MRDNSPIWVARAQATRGQTLLYMGRHKDACLGETASAHGMTQELHELAGLEDTRIGHLAREAALDQLAIQQGKPEEALLHYQPATQIQTETGIGAWVHTLNLLELQI